MCQGGGSGRPGSAHLAEPVELCLSITPAITGRERSDDTVLKYERNWNRQKRMKQRTGEPSMVKLFG